MKRIHTALAKFGLSDNEIAVYTEALKLDETSPYELSRLTDIPRTTVYDVLMDLSLKGLVSLQQSDGLMKQQTKITANNPSKLREILRAKHQELTDIEVDIVEILPELKGEYHKQAANADFRFYPGIEGARKVFFEEDTDEVDLPVYAWTKLMPVDVFGKKELNRLVKKETRFRRTAKTKVKEIVPLNDWTQHVLSYQLAKHKNYLTTREIRLLDNPIFQQYARLAVKGDRVRITCAEEEEIWGLVIHSKALANSLQSIFELTWQMASPVTDKEVKSWGKNEFFEREKKKNKV